MALSDFLVDDTLGSWADEMDNLPTAPAREGGDTRGGGRDDFSSRGDRGGGFPPREDLPLPTSPPYTAFVGNMAFDLTEQDLESFFDGLSVKSVKVIKDRDERPKGFGYVEFGSLDDLKGALERSGTPLAGRTVRISVAEPPKERDGRPGFGGGDRSGSFDDAKFASDWRTSRPGPLPPAPSRGGGFGGGDRGGFERGGDRGDRPPRGDREPLPPSAADTADAWRSARPARPVEPERKRSNFGVGTTSGGAADSEETWSKGSRFTPSAPVDEPRGGPGGRGGFGGGFRREQGQGREREGREESSGPADTGDTWRRGPSRQSTSPTSSNPPTPSVGGRRPLNLLPRTGAPSGTPSPLASPSLPAAKSNPFGAAKPVDVSAREAAVEAKIERQAAHATTHHQHPMSRTGSRTASQRGSSRLNETTTSPGTSPRPVHASPKGSHDGSKDKTGGARREGFSFAAAAGKEDKDAEGVTQSLSEVNI
ncbi:RNA-binding domain-containing protein [Peniophora sp. CONT]|nr:RNA-binding domain-containing protein [Peniophora sp. CONT]